MAQQSSTRFIPAALVSSKPAPPPRPASAAPLRRKYATSTRPSTAGPSTVLSQSCRKGSTPTISAPAVTATAMLQAGRLLPPRRAPPMRPSCQAPLPASPSAVSLPGKQQPATLPAPSSVARCSPSADHLFNVTAMQPATTAECDVESVHVCPSKDTSAASPSSAISEAVPITGSSTAGRSRDGVLETLRGSLAASHPVAKPDAACSDADPSQLQQQQQLPKFRSQTEGQAAEAPALQICSKAAKHDAGQASSRPSSSRSKQGAASPFDRRLALLHKGLPTQMSPPFAALSRPSSRSRRASAPGLPATPLHHPSAVLDPNCLPGSAWTTEVSSAALDAPLQGGNSHGTTPGITTLPSEATALQPEQQTNIAVAPTEQAGHALLGNKGSIDKPSSPTSVLPNQGGLGAGDTTYHSLHGLAEAYPELYKAAAAAGRAEKANSRALQCFVGDTLRGDPDLWRHQLKSAYTLCNDRLKHDAGWGDMEGASDGSFLEWVGRSQLYSGDVLAPEALDDVTGWMAQAAPGDKRQMMALLRELHATISPTGPRMKSVSHSTHTRQVPFADGQLPLASGQAPLASGQVPLACGQLKEAERQLHMRGPTRPGTPLPAGPKAQSPSQVQSNSPGVQAAEETAPQLTSDTQIAGVVKPRGINVNAVPSKGTFKSSICLSEGALPTTQSTYGQVHGASMPQLMLAVRTVAQQHAEAKKPVLVTCPYGTLDPLLDHAHLPLFPVPPALLQQGAQLHTDEQTCGLNATQYGQSFCSQAFRGDAAAILAAAQKEKQESKAAGSRTTIPLGKKAVNCIPVYDTTYHDEFKARSLDISQQRASAEHMRSLYHAPTATVGCVTRSH
ncbi:hypothetical protein ABBQ32_001893 [Trebouxia sp. C0010 RCD-2024]